MTDPTAPPSKEKSLSRRLRDGVVEHPTAAAVASYAVVAIVAAIAAYLALFTVFAQYDDEGTLLVTLKAFANGDTLYRDVYTAYGPFYYELFGGLFALTGHAVTTDASRLIVVVVWVVSSLLFGIAAQRLTGRLMLGITGMIAAFAALGVLVGEPMHPQGLCVLLIGAFILLAVLGPTRHVGWAGAGCGALVAALTLTKINLGVFAIAAVVLAAVWSVGPLYRRSWVRWPVIAAFLAMPLLITARDLEISWTRELMALEVLAAVALGVAAWPLRPKRGEDDEELKRWLVAGIGGFVIAFLVTLGALFLTGPSPSDVYDGVVTQAFRIRDVLVLQFPFPPAALDWGIAAVAAAFLTTRLRTGGGQPTIWSGLLRAAAGLTILCVVAHVVPVALSPSATNPDTLPMLLAWVAAIPIAGAGESPYKRFIRVLLPALAIAESLQVYPVAGSQMGIAAVVFVPVGALCLADALIELRAWATLCRPPSLERLDVVAGVATVAIAAVFALNTILLPAATSAITYRNEQKLPFPGAGLMHMPTLSVETYVALVDLLHRFHCSTFIGYPNINSLYLWSGLEAPKPQIPNAWMKGFDRTQQVRVLNELRAAPRTCVIRNQELVELYLHGEPPPKLPLVHYVLNDFRQVAKGGGYEFLVPKSSATAP